MQPRQLKFVKAPNDRSYSPNYLYGSQTNSYNLTRTRNASSSVNDLFNNLNVSIDKDEEKLTFVSPRSFIYASPLIANRRHNSNSKISSPNYSPYDANIINSQSVFYGPKSTHDKSKNNGNLTRVCYNMSHEDLLGMSTNYSRRKNSPNNNKISKKLPIFTKDTSEDPSNEFKFYEEEEEESPRLMAKNMFTLNGYNLDDVAIILGKKSDQANKIRQEFGKLFNFSNISIDEALREFLLKVILSGESQERERILECFSKRFSHCNPSYSKESSHTLTCALVLLNTDLYGQNIGTKMNYSAFAKNLNGLNDGDNFSPELLKIIFQSIKKKPLPIFSTKPNIDEDVPNSASVITNNQFLNKNIDISGPEFRKGHLLRKCCLDINGQRTNFGKRGWRVFFAVLRNMVLFLYKNMTDDINDPAEVIHVHHSLASAIPEYIKRPYVFKLQTCDQAEYLLQARNDIDCKDWIENINIATALLSSPPLAAGVGSQMIFARPLMPSALSKNTPVEQLRSHHQSLQMAQKEIKANEKNPPSKQDGSKALQNYVEREFFWKYEHLRFSTYCQALHRFLQSPLGKSGKLYANDQRNIHRTTSDRLKLRKHEQMFSSMTCVHQPSAIIFESKV